MTKLDEPIRPRIEEVSILGFSCPCESDGTFTVFGLRYHSPAWDVLRAGAEAEGAVDIILDHEDMSKLLVREPMTGCLLSGTCREASYAFRLPLWVHLGRLARARPKTVPALERLVVQALGVEHLLKAA